MSSRKSSRVNNLSPSLCHSKRSFNHHARFFSCMLYMNLLIDSESLGSSGIRLSGFAGTSHCERGSVMDSDFWASRILVAQDLFRVPVGRSRL